MADASAELSHSERIGVVGGGAMGVGIVYVFAAAGFPVSPASAAWTMFTSSRAVT